MSIHSIHDGGPAYPVMPNSAAPGMSLRDAMAISVAGHIWTSFLQDGTALQYDNWRQGVAVEAYRLADEMIRAREQGA